jgi:hypothetical protein
MFSLAVKVPQLKELRRVMHVLSEKTPMFTTVGVP